MRETKPWPGESMETRSGHVGERDRERKIRERMSQKLGSAMTLSSLHKNLLSHSSKGWQNWFLLKTVRKKSSKPLS